MSASEIIATGNAAIELAETDSTIRLNKYADPVEDALENISVDLAREVAKEDASLIYATK